MKLPSLTLSTDVIVHRENIAFPSRCVVCDLESHAETVGLRGNPVGFYGVLPWLFRRTKKLHVPAHAHCGSKLWWAILLRNLSLIVGVLIALIFAVSIGLAKWQAIGFAVALILLPIIWQVVRPLPFKFTHHGERFNLMFASKALAREVAALNDGHIDDDVKGDERGLT
jgi:hypothetical protein